MAEKSGFFDAHMVNGEYDRVYLSEQFAKYFASFIGNGVFGGKSNELMVTEPSSAGMKVNVMSGMGWINGFWYENTSDLALEIAIADGVLNRIDNVVVKWGKVERNIWVEIVKGVPAVDAVAPVVERNSEYYELKLAEIHVNAGLVGVTQANIVDTRLNSEVCGFVAAVIKQFDTTEFGKQLDGYISSYSAEYRDHIDMLEYEASEHAAEYKAFLEELELDGSEELNRVLERLNDLIVDENALATLALEINDVASEAALASQTLGYVKKNLIPYPYDETTHDQGGIVWTDNKDGTITANGVSTTETYFVLYKDKMPSPGKYFLSDDVNLTTSHYIYALKMKKTDDSVDSDMYRGHSNIPFEITESDVINYNLFIAIVIERNVNVSNVTFKPMLRRAEIFDDTWEPYRLSVAEMIQEDMQNIGCFYRINRKTGVKEWLNPPYVPGVEYPLAERWNNEPVYQMTFYAASLPNNNVLVLETNAEWNRTVSISGYAIDHDDLTSYPFPVILHNQVTPIAVISRVESDGSLVITTNGDASYLEAYITIKYTKSY